MKTYKRYLYWGPNGITWTKWFIWRHEEVDISKLPKKDCNKLLVEYKVKD